MNKRRTGLVLPRLRGRGIGEIGITGVSTAIANAVFNATGKRIRELPITLDKLLRPTPATVTVGPRRRPRAADSEAR